MSHSFYISHIMSHFPYLSVWVASFGVTRFHSVGTSWIGLNSLFLSNVHDVTPFTPFFQRLRIKIFSCALEMEKGSILTNPALKFV